MVHFLEMGQLSLLLSLLLLRLCFSLITALVVLYVLIVDSKSFVNLGLESRIVLNAMNS
jgi:hypothetical protein